MVESHANFLNDRRVGSYLFLSSSNVFTVLPTSAVTTEHTGEKGEGTLFSVIFHFLERVWQHGVPVSIAPVNWQINSCGRELLTHRVQQVTILFIDWANPTKVVIVLCDL